MSVNVSDFSQLKVVVQGADFCQAHFHRLAAVGALAEERATRPHDKLFSRQVDRDACVRFISNHSRPPVAFPLLAEMQQLPVPGTRALHLGYSIQPEVEAREKFIQLCA